MKNALICIAILIGTIFLKAFLDTAKDTKGISLDDDDDWDDEFLE